MIKIIVLLFLSFDVVAGPLSVFADKGAGVKFKTPSGVSASSDFATLVSKGSNQGGVESVGRLPVEVARNPFDVLVTRPVTSSALGAAAAEAILSKSWPGAIATLALPYLIDAVTGQVMKEVNNPPTSPETSYFNQAGSIVRDAGYTACGSRYMSSWSEAYQQAICAAGLLGWSNPRNPYHAQSGSVIRVYVLYGAGAGSYGVPFNVSVGSSCPPGSSWVGNPQWSCMQLTCTAPSTFDSATGMCLGSAINEPANRAQLEADIEDSLHNNPSAPVAVLDGLLDNGITPDYSPTRIPDPIPSVDGETTREVTGGVDPATGHPTTTTKETKRRYDMEPGDQSSPQSGEITVYQVDVTTTTITDNVTNISTVTTTTTTTEPAPDAKPQDEGSFAGVSPGDGRSAGKAAIVDALVGPCGGDCETGPAQTPASRFQAFKNQYAFAMTAGGECPAFAADLSGQGYGNHVVTGHCGLLEQQRGTIATIANIMIAIAFVFIVLGA